VRVRPFAGKLPRFGRRVFVASTAVVIGDVDLGDDVSVWYGAVLRADLQAIRIGARSNIQDDVVVHVDEPDFAVEVGEDVTIGHAAVLHGCRVERGALVGIHATVLNGAVVGEEAIVAAGAVVPPGLAVPPRTLVAGVPARVVREVAEEEVGRVRRGVRNYLAAKTRYLAAEDERELADPDDGARLL
jgi:carbonic anhydrase/acetyltransferase-like protein (isoleucine patch superfamily)